MADQVSTLAVEVLDPSKWTDGGPDERQLIAFFSRFSVAEAAAMTRRMIAWVVEQIVPSPEQREWLASRNAPGAPPVGEDDAQSRFIGGEWLAEALQAVASSERRSRAHLENLVDLLEAVGCAVGRCATSAAIAMIPASSNAGSGGARARG